MLWLLLSSFLEMGCTGDDGVLGPERMRNGAGGGRCKNLALSS